MRLPRGHLAIIDDRKLVEYVLNPEHPVGRHHAALFKRVLGIGPADFLLLKESLRRAAVEVNATAGRASLHGRKYEVRFPLAGPRGSAMVLAVWLIEAGTDAPRLITCYVE